jgi:hypothetical protein
MSAANADIVKRATHAYNIDNVQGLLPIYYNQPYLDFTTSKRNQPIAVTFSANCNTDGWLYIRVLVDGQPTYTDNNIWSVYCSVDGSGDANEEIVTKLTTYDVPNPGRHNLTVEAIFYGNWYSLYAATVLIER